MYRKISSVAAVAVGAGVFAGGPVQAQVADTFRVASGLSRPIFVNAPPGDMNRLFIVEQRGNPAATSARIMILDLTTNPPTLLGAPFMTVTNVTTGNEQGLLGMTFHPQYATNGMFYVDYTTTGGGAAGKTRIARYHANPASNTADVGETIIIEINQPETNHNGGWIGFGPDGYLYIAMGDGGGANDQHGVDGNGQNINVLLGKMLRLDVDGADNIPGNDDDDGVLGNGSTGGYTSPPTNPFVGVAGSDEIWAYGLRNPWRDSFDRSTGQLYIGDVGQFAIEEIDVQPADVGGSQAGKNYGWRCMEGNNCTGLSGCTCNAPALTLPVHTYTHAGGACSVTGGYVYRGSAIPSLQGHYFFADYCSNQIFTFQYAGVNNPPVTNRTADLSPSTNGFTVNTITSFGEDAAGEVYICDQGGEIFKIVPTIPANDTCANATNVGNVTNQPFTNFAATTDGPDEAAACNFNGYTNIGSDIWYKYLATCTGTATVSLCGSSFNTKLAAYFGCPTGPGQTLACNDDDCGQQSRISFPVTQSTLYRIRIGGFQGATGNGLLTITCTAAPPPCPWDIDGNNVVNIDDLLAVILAWGPCGDCKNCPADIDNDCDVDIDDLISGVIVHWGPCPM